MQDLLQAIKFLTFYFGISTDVGGSSLLRWNRVNRNVRFCNVCDVVGDERHYIYDCPTVDREQLVDLPPALKDLATYIKLPILLNELKPYL